MNDQFDVDVHDAEALEEIELLANLIVATSEHDGRMPQSRIDEILGVTAVVRDAAPIHEVPQGDTGDMPPSAGGDVPASTSEDDGLDAAPPD